MSVLISAVPLGRLSRGRLTVCQELPSHRATAKVEAPGLAGGRGPTIQMADGDRALAPCGTTGTVALRQAWPLNRTTNGRPLVRLSPNAQALAGPKTAVALNDDHSGKLCLLHLVPFQPSATANGPALAW
jgi:hypothetical protein